MKQQVEKIFTDLEAYHDFCRFELREFDPAVLYKKSDRNWRAYLAFKNNGKNFRGRNFRRHSYSNNKS